MVPFRFSWISWLLILLALLRSAAGTASARDRRQIR